MRIVVSGQLAKALDQGGAAWVVLQYLLGLRRLGYDVYFIESIDGANLTPAESALHTSRNAAYFTSVMRRFGLDGRSSLLDLERSQSVGLGIAAVGRVCRTADLLINLSGSLREPSLMEKIPVRVYLDIDPGFTQLWQAEEGIDMGFAGHTHFVTIGESLGRPGCDLPTCGIDWIATRQPVVLEEWPPAGAIERQALTTIANWRGYGSVNWQGVFYGQKAHSLRPFFSLPRLTSERFELALAIHEGETPDLEALSANGWHVLDPAAVAACPDAYRRFIQGSRAEFGIAKSGYVLGKTGWFSDRSVCYLASARPVIAQDTGFASIIPAGEGLFAFETLDDVLTAIDRLNSDYAGHSRAARLLAEQYFDSDRVLGGLLDKLFEQPSRAGAHGR